MSVHDVPFVDDCQRYVSALVPPLAAVVDVSVAAVLPAHILWFEPIAPALIFSATVIIITLEVTVLLEPSNCLKTRFVYSLS